MFSAAFRTFAALAFGILLPLAVVAESSTPKALVEEIVNRLKSTGNAAVVLEYVHWPTAFESLPLDDRRLMEISSADEFKTYVNNMVMNPQEFVRREYATRLENAKPDERKEIERRMAAAIAEIQSQKGEVQQKISRTSYTIGDPVGSGDTVQVPLTATLDGETKQSIVTLRSVGGRWYLPTADFGPSRGSPQG